MFVPEYTLTAKTLKNISTVEYSRAIIENTVVLQNWEKKLVTQTLIDEIYANLQLEGFTYSPDLVKKSIDGIEQDYPLEIIQMHKAFEIAEDIGKQNEINETGLKNINKALTEKNTYRSKHIQNKTSSAEILAEIVELFDWINSIDARDSHPIIVAAITKARLEEITPFDNFNSTSSNLIAKAVLQSFNYSFKNFVGLGTYFNRGKKDYYEKTKVLNADSSDFTQWIEYFSEAYSTQAISSQEKIKLLAKDTKIAKAAGRIKLTPRQEKIVEYLQDYGILQNKDFPMLFPDKSEDTILRDLKALIDHEIIQKVGSTKSSRYELR